MNQPTNQTNRPTPSLATYVPSQPPNQQQSLALASIANIGGAEFAEALTPDVQARLYLSIYYICSCWVVHGF